MFHAAGYNMFILLRACTLCEAYWLYGSTQVVALPTNACFKGWQVDYLGFCKAVQRLQRERQPRNSKDDFSMRVNPRSYVRIDDYRRRKLLGNLVVRDLH